MVGKVGKCILLNICVSPKNESIYYELKAAPKDFFVKCACDCHKAFFPSHPLLVMHRSRLSVIPEDQLLLICAINSIQFVLDRFPGWLAHLLFVNFWKLITSIGWRLKLKDSFSRLIAYSWQSDYKPVGLQLDSISHGSTHHTGSTSRESFISQSTLQIDVTVAYKQGGALFQGHRDRSPFIPSCHFANKYDCVLILIFAVSLSIRRRFI